MDAPRNSDFPPPPPPPRPPHPPQPQTPWPPFGQQQRHQQPPPPASRARRLAAPLLTLAGAVAAFSYVGAVDPNEPGHYPVCPLLRLTGIYCPGCGGLRSAHAFAHGDLVTALGENALAVLGYFFFAGFTALWLVRAFRGAPAPQISPKPAHWWALGALLLTFAIVRNFPFGSVLAP